MKFRILEKNGAYYPQYKRRWSLFWRHFKNHHTCFDNEGGAHKYMYDVYHTSFSETEKFISDKISDAFRRSVEVEREVLAARKVVIHNLDYGAGRGARDYIQITHFTKSTDQALYSQNLFPPVTGSSYPSFCITGSISPLPTQPEMESKEAK
jgi:hypothetical protein